MHKRVYFDKTAGASTEHGDTYSQLSLSRLRLSRITAYLEEKIWSLFNTEI